MAETNTLSQAFLEREPLAAAQVLEELDDVDAAAFLEEVPIRLAAPVVTCFAPWFAARCLVAMTPSAAAGLIRTMPYMKSVSALRVLDDAALEGVLDDLPDSLVGRLRNSLAYPKGSVGAWMDQGVPLFNPDDTIGDVTRYLKRSRRDALHVVFVCDRNEQFMGLVLLDLLWRYAAKTELVEIADKDVRPLSSYAALRGVFDDTGWDEHSMLPVEGRRGNVVGGLSRSAMRFGLKEAHRAHLEGPSDTLLGSMAQSYGVAMTGLMRALVSLPATAGETKRSQDLRHVG